MSDEQNQANTAEGQSELTAVVMQRFRAALTNGYWPDNPEPLVRDANGDYVKFVDHVKDIMEWDKYAYAKLGVLRDKMTAEEVEIVQKFLSA